MGYAGGMIDHDILSSLQSIRGILLWLTVAVVVNAAIGLARLTVFARSEWLKVSGQVFQMVADSYLKKGEFRELSRFCNDQLKEHPNHAYALWYLGIAQFQLKDFDTAKLSFRRLAEISPNWEANFIKPYLDKIDEVVAKSR